MSDLSHKECCVCGDVEYSCECDGGYVDQNDLFDVVYVAYQGDVGKFKTIWKEMEWPSFSERSIKLKAAKAFKACLEGWWSRHECVESGFVVRLCPSGWRVFEVSKADDGWTASEIEQGFDVANAPIGLPFTWDL